MKLRTIIDNVNGRYQVQVETFGFTANEEEQMANFGEPLIDVGGSFSGTVNRPGTTNTSIAIAGDGLGATAVPIVQNGSITGATVTNLGSGYTVAPVTFAGDGSGAAGTARFGLASLVINPGSLGFAPNDILTFISPTPGDINIQLKVLTIGPGGSVASVEIVNPGNFTTVPANPITTWTVSGVGTGFDATLSWGVVEIQITSGGAGWNVTPLTTSFTLPNATRRLRTDSPFKEVFDLEDDPDSDAKAKVWGETIVARALAAKNALLSQQSPFEGETVITG